MLADHPGQADRLQERRPRRGPGSINQPAIAPRRDSYISPLPLERGRLGAGGDCKVRWPKPASVTLPYPLPSREGDQFLERSPLQKNQARHGVIAVPQRQPVGASPSLALRISMALTSAMSSSSGTSANLAAALFLPAMLARKPLLT